MLNVLCGVGTLEHIINIGLLGTAYMVPNTSHCLLSHFQRSKSPIGKGSFEWGKGQTVVKYITHTSPRSVHPFLHVQKRMNRSRCRLGCGLEWTEGCTSSIVFSMWRQCALMGRHVAATWRIRLNHPSAAAMRLMSNYFDQFYLWPRPLRQSHR